jgi:type I restriction enzyme M protein
VLSNPPFSQDYIASSLRDEQKEFGTAPENGKADLMFLQHMLAVLDRNDSKVVTVMPHGVLFRGREERKIRTRLLDADRLEAVIGLASNVFYGTGIPACVMVLCPEGARADDDERRGKVLFINADTDFQTEGIKNVLLPEHINKIVSTYHAFEDVPGYAKVVDRETLAEHDDDLNIRLYCDNTPPPEPHDIGAHLVGGVPRSEVAAKTALLDRYSLTATDLFDERDADYLDFRTGDERIDAERLAALTRPREQQLQDLFSAWWQQESERIAELAGDSSPADASPDELAAARIRLLDVRADLLGSFTAAFGEVDLLDPYALAGIIASWWQEFRYDLAALPFGGFARVVGSWLDSVEAIIEPEVDPKSGKPRKKTAAERRVAYDQPLPLALIPEFRTEFAEAMETKASLDAQWKAATGAAQDPEDGGDEEPDDDAPQLSAEQLKALDTARKAAGRRVRALEEDFLPSLTQARLALGPGDEKATVLGILRNALAARVEEHLAGARHELTDTFMRWEAKYAVPLRLIQQRRQEATDRLDAMLQELGHVR